MFTIVIYERFTTQITQLGETHRPQNEKSANRIPKDQMYEKRQKMKSQQIRPPLGKHLSRVYRWCNTQWSGPLRFPKETPNVTLSKSELLNRSIENFARLITSARSRAVPKIVTIGCTVPSTHARNITFPCAFFVFVFAFFCVLKLVHSPNEELHKDQ